MTSETAQTSAAGAPSGSPRRSTFRRWGVPFIVVFGAAALLNAGCQAMLNSTEPSGDSRALVACHHAVEAQLAHPATADFQTFSTTIEENEIRGVVEAQNSFGVTDELTYVCARAGSSVTSATVLGF